MSSKKNKNIKKAFGRDMPRVEEIESGGEGLLKQKSTFQTIFLIFAILMIFLPFITTFNEFLTKIIEKFQFYIVIEDYVVPYLSRLVGVVLMPFGFQIMGTPEGLFLPQKALDIQIAWNCVGWQSMILIIITLFTGLQGGYTRYSKLQCVLIGLLGTFLFNVIRIALVVMVAVYFGYFPAVIFHDYFSNLLIVLWLFFFWWFSYAYVLESSGLSTVSVIQSAKRHSRFGLRLPLKVGEIKNRIFSKEKSRPKAVPKKNFSKKSQKKIKK